MISPIKNYTHNYTGTVVTEDTVTEALVPATVSLLC